jgi:hypothetical protein
MRMRHWIAVFASAAFALASCAAFGQGNGHGKGNGKDKDKDDDRASERVEFRQHERDSMDGPLASTENVLTRGQVRPILIAYFVRIYPCSTPAESK